MNIKMDSDEIKTLIAKYLSEQLKREVFVSEIYLYFDSIMDEEVIASYEIPK